MDKLLSHINSIGWVLTIFSVYFLLFIGPSIHKIARSLETIASKRYVEIRSDDIKKTGD